MARKLNDQNAQYTRKNRAKKKCSYDVGFGESIPRNLIPFILIQTDADAVNKILGSIFKATVSFSAFEFHVRTFRVNSSIAAY